MNLNLTLLGQTAILIIFFAVVQTLLMKWVWDTIISDVFSVRNISHVEAFKFVLLVTVMRSFVDFMPN